MPQYLERVSIRETRLQSAEAHTRDTPSRGALLTRIAPWVSQLVKQREPDSERQKDLFQETMLAVWLAGVGADAANPGLAHAMDIAGKVTGYHAWNGQPRDDVAFVPVDDVELPSDENPEADAIVGEESRRLLEGLGELERKILGLSLQGHTLLEIRLATGIPRSTVQNRLEWTLRFLARRAHIKNP